MELETQIKQFEKKIEKWNKKYSLQEKCKFVFNENLLSIANIKYILVVDNPGEKEVKKNKYLIGDAGQIAKTFFKDFLDIEYFEQNVLVLNKTPIHTPVTSDLKSINYDILAETQEYMAQLTFDLYSLLKVPVVISGFMDTYKDLYWEISEKRKKIGAPFFRKFKELFNEHKNDVTIIKHFSRNMIYHDIKKDYLNTAKHEGADILKLLDKGYSYSLFHNGIHLKQEYKGKNIDLDMSIDNKKEFKKFGISVKNGIISIGGLKNIIFLKDTESVKVETENGIKFIVKNKDESINTIEIFKENDIIKLIIDDNFIRLTSN